MIHASSATCRPGSLPPSSLASCRRTVPAVPATPTTAIRPTKIRLGRFDPLSSPTPLRPGVIIFPRSTILVDANPTSRGTVSAQNWSDECGEPCPTHSESANLIALYSALTRSLHHPDRATFFHLGRALRSEGADPLLLENA